MSYRIEFSKSALKQLKKFSNDVQNQIIQKMDELTLNPRCLGYKKLVDVGSYRVRVGDYRIIYDIDDKIVSILIVKIGHRKDVYR